MQFSGTDTYTKNGWQSPASTLYILLGQASVVLFFLITSFLFISRILESKDAGFDFAQFFRSRLFRIIPLYYVLFAVVFFIAMSLTEWRLQGSGSLFSKSILQWVLFLSVYDHAINGLAMTELIFAGVTWSLTYEWLFYCTMPLVAWLVNRKNGSLKYTLIGMGYVVMVCLNNRVSVCWLYPFVFGAVLAVLFHRFPTVVKMKDWKASIGMLGCLLLLGMFDSIYSLRCSFVIAVLFYFVVAGGSIFAF